MPVTPPTSPTRRVTLRDVARHAGVGEMSVSVVLNNSRSNTGVSAMTREKIMLAAQELGYRRNGHMAAARSGKFDNVALLLSTQEHLSMLPPAILLGFSNELSKHNIHISLFHMPDEELTDPQHFPKIFREWMADGLVIDYTHAIPARLIEVIEKQQLPAVWLNTQREFDCVRPDDFRAAQELGEHLLELGHERVFYVDFTNDENDLASRSLDSKSHYSVYDRFQGLKSAFEARQIDVPFLACHLQEFDERVDYMKEVLLTQRPTAIVSYAGEGMDSTYMAARDLGIRVPDELSIVGFGPRVFRFLGVLFTTMIIPERDIGMELGRMILRKIEHPEHKIPFCALPLVLDAGHTCAPAPRFSTHT